MRPARWDIEWRIGGGWRVRLQRRTASGEVLPLADPCVFQVRRRNEPESTAPQLTLTGARVATESGDAVDFHATATQVRELGVGVFEHVLLVGDPSTDEPLVLTEGYLRNRNRVGTA